MPALELRFPGGRYHATPSGMHVNEGHVEWPPSPWRIVRALIACGYTTQHWDGVPTAARRMVEQLCSTLPEYRLPRAALGHSRHYMPLGVLEKGREKTTLVLDTFADVGREGALYVIWPVDLDTEALEQLRVLVEHLGYLGRSESWVLGRLIADSEVPASGACVPHREGARPGRRFEQVTVLAPELPVVFESWRTAELAGALAEHLPAPGEKPTKTQLKRRQEIEDGYPRDLVDALQWDTARWRGARWSQAPGSRRVLYWREASALEVSPPSGPRPAPGTSVEAFLFALTTPSGSRSALPMVTRTLPQADLLHKALVAKADGQPCPELVGRDAATRRPLQGHRHAHILPLDLDQDGQLDHIVVFAQMGLGPEAQRAARAVKKTYTKGGVGELRLAVAGHGRLASMLDLPGKLGDSARGVFGTARTWVTLTPFVPPRYLKRKGANTLTGQLAAELRARALPEAKVTVLPWDGPARGLRHFVRRRGAGAPQPPADVAFAIRLEFDRPMPGPICLGYGSHFGMGLFRAEEA